MITKKVKGGKTLLVTEKTQVTHIDARDRDTALGN